MQNWTSDNRVGGYKEYVFSLFSRESSFIFVNTGSQRKLAFLVPNFKQGKPSADFHILRGFLALATTVVGSPCNVFVPNYIRIFLRRNIIIFDV